MDFAIGCAVGLATLTFLVLWHIVRKSKQAEEDAQEKPYHAPVDASSEWRHHNGNRYVVLFLTNETSSDQRRYPTTVVYRNMDIGSLWSRPLVDWHRSFRPLHEK